MSQTTTLRLPYADAETPHQMHDDCRAVGTRLRLPTRPQEPSTKVRPAPSWAVSERTAAFAGTLHLHLD